VLQLWLERALDDDDDGGGGGDDYEGDWEYSEVMADGERSLQKTTSFSWR
jgi:hypothetical protein